MTSLTEAAKKFAQQMDVPSEPENLNQLLFEKNPKYYKTLLKNEGKNNRNQWINGFNNSLLQGMLALSSDEVQQSLRKIAELDKPIPNNLPRINPEPGTEANYPPFLVGGTQPEVKRLSRREMRQTISLPPFLEKRKNG